MVARWALNEKHGRVRCLLQSLWAMPSDVTRPFPVLMGLDFRKGIRHW